VWYGIVGKNAVLAFSFFRARFLITLLRSFFGFTLYSAKAQQKRERPLWGQSKSEA
jgi:hypothetical protein